MKHLPCALLRSRNFSLPKNTKSSRTLFSKKITTFIIAFLLFGRCFGVTTAFNTLDASDGTTDGIYTVTGNLQLLSGDKIIGPGGAFGIKINVSGNLIMDSGSQILGDVTAASANGIPITITVNGNVTLNGTALISSKGAAFGCGDGGNVSIIATTGNIVTANGSIISANGCSGGAIVVKSLNPASTITLNGLVQSKGTQSGVSNQPPGGGPVTIISGCKLYVNPTGIVSSEGADPGADLVHLEACVVNITGLVQSTSVGHVVPINPPNNLHAPGRPDKPANSTGGVEVWASDSLVIDQTGTNKGEINADLTGGAGCRSWIDLFARNTIIIRGNSSACVAKFCGTTGNTCFFAVHAINGGAGNQGGTITVKSIAGEVITGGRAIVANSRASSNGGSGGIVTLQANLNVNISDASIWARGCSGTGGSINVKSFNGSILNNAATNFIVVGGTSSGTVTLSECGATPFSGTTNGVAGPAPSTGSCGLAPSLPCEKSPDPTCSCVCVPYVVLPAGCGNFCCSQSPLSAGTYGPVCISDAAITLTGSPAGGTFSGPGVSGNTFNPATAGTGSKIITYTHASNCNSPATTTILVNGLPGASAGLDGQITCPVPTIHLVGSSPTLGVNYSWKADDASLIIAGSNTATPTIVSPANFILTVTNPSTGCVSRDTALVTEIPCILPYYLPPPQGKVYDIIGSELNSLFNLFTAGNMDPAALKDIFLIQSDSVWIEIITLEGQTATCKALMQTAGFGMTDFIDNGPNSLIISGKFPIANLLKLNPLTTLIDYVRPLYPAIATSGIVYTNGDLAQNSAFARNGFNVNGEGIKVGVLSDSYNTILGNPAGIDIANGDLPGVGNPEGNTTPVNVLREFPIGIREDEGRAMLQIVHDIAPKAKLDFRTGFISEGDFAQGIRQLKADTCQVIVDDVTFITSPFLKDGIVAQAVNEVTAQGVSYFSAAGNFGDQSYEQNFVPAPASGSIVGQAHNFGGGDIFQNISLTPGNYTIVLQWQDSIYSLFETTTGTQNDLDIYLTRDNGATLFGFNRNNINGDPLEVLPFTVTANTSTNIMIVRAVGSANVRFKYVVFRGNIVFNEYHTGTSTVVGQANAAGAMAVGASRYNRTPAFNQNPPLLESFSSVGGTQVNGVPRNKPDFTSADGVNTSVNFNSLNIENDLFPNFFGTSAAAPHAAGGAALLLSAKKKFYDSTFTSAQMRTLLQTTSHDMDAPGFDLKSGSGLIDIGAAMLTMAAPTPVITDLLLPNGSIVPGTVSFVVTVQGLYYTTQSKILFRGNPLPTTYISGTQLSATIPTFTGNPDVQVFTPPIVPNINDGGLSNTLHFFSPTLKHVVITADNKTKKYGEQLPVFTSTITVDGLSPAAAGVTLADLGLAAIQYSTPATSASNVGIYFIHPSAGPFTIGQQELYNYTFNDGFLSVNKMPLVITPHDTTLIYGEPIKDIQFDYAYDHTNIPPGEDADFLDSLEAAHAANMADALAFVDGSAITNGKVITNLDLNTMAMIASATTITNGKVITNVLGNGKVITNINSSLTSGIVVPGGTVDTTYLIEIAPQSIFNYGIDSANTILEDPGTGSNSRALLNGKVITNLSGAAMVNGKVITNLDAMLNSSSVNDTSNSNVAAIIDEDDVASNDPIQEWKSINMITGYTVGSWYIVPGALISPNFEISYTLGALVIEPDTITVKAEDKSTTYGVAPAYTATVSGFHYGDSLENVLTAAPTYSPSGTNISAGTHPIVPSASLIQPSNYILRYVNGTLNVSQATLNATAVDTFKVFGSLNPAFRIAYTGFLNGDGPANITQPTATTTATQFSAVGTYTITLSGGSSTNYIINKTNGKLTVNPATLTATAVNKTKVFGTANPALTISYSGFLNGDGPGSITQPTAGTTATQFSNVGTYTITLTGGSATNYTINKVNGILSVTPAVLTATADNKTKVYGTANPAFTISYSGFLNGELPGSITQPTASTTALQYSSVGTYTITLTGGSATNYTITKVNGKLTVTPAALTATAVNKTKVYGSVNPALTISYAGFLNGDGPGNITQPTMSTTATQFSNVGTYTITLTGGGTGSNYTLTRINGVLTITKAAITVTADLKYITMGQMLPKFTSTITGFISGGNNTISSGPVYTLSPAYSGAPGTYTITPSALVLAQPNYTISYVNGIFIVNPKGNGTSNVKPALVCVETLVNHPSGFAYVAHMMYTNPNATTVYIPFGSDNNIASKGSHSGTQPTVFPPGFGYFDLYFDGIKMTWTLNSFNGTSKASAASDASSTSNKCHARMAEGSLESAASSNITVYPNPAKDHVVIRSDNPISVNDIVLLDLVGKYHMVDVLRSSENEVELNLSALSAGIYLVRINQGDGNTIFRIVKQ